MYGRSMLTENIKECAKKEWGGCECNQKCLLHNPHTFKVIIAGSRDFNDYELLQSKMNHLLKNTSNVEIVSGGARGADRLAISYAHERGLKLTVMNAKWDEHGKSAGIKRNMEMGDYADAAVVFNMGTPGSTHMVEYMKSLGKQVREIKV